MQKNPYLVLGLDENCTFAELDDAYKSLSTKYKEDRFLEGEAGFNATKKLEELDLAYEECKRLMQEKATYESADSIYKKVGDLIKSGNIDEAQQKLDIVEYRDAEWHYYQSIIYYKKSWFEDSKKQLEIAVSLDPDNQKYKQALSNLVEDMAKSNPYQNPNAQNQAGYNNPNYNQQRGGYVPPQNNAARNSQACCDTCCALACLDSCCECCGGDLISCC